MGMTGNLHGGLANRAAQLLDVDIADPEKLIPGQKMAISVPEPRDRADIIQYLKEESRR